MATSAPENKRQQGEGGEYSPSACILQTAVDILNEALHDLEKLRFTGGKEQNFVLHSASI
jgi:hypothetical protein